MKILHIITSLDIGGAEIVLSNLIKKQKVQHKSVVICIKVPGEISKQIEAYGTPVFSLGVNKNWKFFLALLKLIKIIKIEKPDIVNTWLYHADLIGFIASKLCFKKYVIWNIRCSDIDIGGMNWSTSFILRINAFLSRFVSCIIVNSNNGKIWHSKRKFHPQAWEYIPNGYELSDWAINVEKTNEIRGELGFSEGSFVIGMVARYDKLKDHETFLKAMSIVLKKLPNVTIVMIGKNIDSSNTELLRVIKSCGLNSNIQLLGLQHELSKFYSSMDLLVVSSLTEGFPNVIGEAMSAGLPCLSTDVGDASLLINDAKRIVPIKNPVEMASKVIKYINSGKEEWKYVSESSKDRILKQYSLDKMIDSYYKLYKLLVN
jgi:glycosyltransferase involved in cell wall biosynthesis